MKIDRLIGILSILLQEEKTTAPELAEKFEDTTLLEGSVLLTTQNLLHPTVLKPNEQFVYNKRTRSALLQQVPYHRYHNQL